MIAKKYVLTILSLLITIIALGCDKASTESDAFDLWLSPTHVSYYGGSNGSIRLTADGGDAPYQYTWSTGDTTKDISNLTAGVYSVFVQDAVGVTATDSVEITQPSNPIDSRTYYFHVPASYTGNAAVPLVIALHNYGSSGQEFEEYTGFSSIADTAGFIVVYPDATGSPSEWNAGIGLTPSTLSVDDVSFVSGIIEKFLLDYNIDPNRVYITGFSNGSIMTHKLAAELSSKITAVGAVAGPGTQAVYDDFAPDRPIGLIHFHMLNDPSLEYDGGVLNGVPYPAIEDVITTWASFNGCQSTPNIIYDANGILGRQWNSDNTHADVVFYRLNEGGHSWPRNPISATKLIWEFFRSHPRE